MKDKIVIAIGLVISIVIWIGLLAWDAGYEDPRSAVELQIREERENW